MLTTNPQKSNCLDPEKEIRCALREHNLKDIFSLRDQLAFKLNNRLYSTTNKPQILNDYAIRNLINNNITAATPWI